MRGLQKKGPWPWAYWEDCLTWAYCPCPQPSRAAQVSGIGPVLRGGWALAAAGYQADTEENMGNREDYLLLFT